MPQPPNPRVLEPPPVRVTLPEHVQLARGHELIIRPIETTDLAGLAALFEGLDDVDRYRRFFSAYHPSVAVLERMIAAADRGGLSLVAEARTNPDEPGRLVGEASYEPLPNGDGEMAITVSGDWRGWLGPFLLDELIRAAAERGIPNLEADVLATNAPMLAIARARGAIDLARDDWSVIRLLLGTSSTLPAWPGSHDRRRVLVEGSAGPAAAQARQAGDQVLTCPGPTRLQVRCPALAGESCALASGADRIIIALPDAELGVTLAVAHRGCTPASRSWGPARSPGAMPPSISRNPASSPSPRSPRSSTPWRAAGSRARGRRSRSPRAAR